MTDYEQLTGKVIGNEVYKLQELIITTNMSVVYKGLDTRLNEKVAIKIKLRSEPESDRRFRNEAIIMRRGLRHENIVHVHHHNVLAPEPESLDGLKVRYIVFEWIDGGSLQQMIDNMAAQPIAAAILLREAVRIFKPIASAVDYINDKGIIHRDIKPSNILLTRRGQPMLTDFGIAKIPIDAAMTEVDVGGEAQAQEGRIGSARFKSPEMVTRPNDVTRQSDQYSLALTLYEYLSGGASPYEHSINQGSRTTGTASVAASTSSWDEAHQRTAPTSIRFYRSDISEAVWQVLAKAMSKLPQQRYPTCSAFLDAFDNAVLGGGNGVEPESQPRPRKFILTEFLRRYRYPVGLAVGIIALLAAALSLPSLVGVVPTPAPSATEIADVVTRTPTETLTWTVTPSQTATPTLTSTPNATQTFQAILAERATQTEIALQAERVLQLTTLFNAGLTSTSQAATLTSTALTPLPTASFTPTMTPTASFTPTMTPTVTLTPTLTPSATSTQTLTPSPVPTAFGGGRGEFLFESDRDGDVEIYVYSFATQETVQITENTSSDGFPSWSADRRLIVFQSDESGTTQIYTMRLDGSDMEQLTSKGSNSRPTWSPDGAQIAFESDRDGQLEIYVMDFETRQETRITNAEGNDFFPAWSPDGTRIAFSSDRDGDNEIFVVDLTSRDLDAVQVTDNTADDAAVSWAPGNELVYRSDVDGNFEIYRQDVDSGRRRRLTFMDSHEARPVWSANRLNILFASDAQGTSDIFIMTAGGTEIQPVVATDAHEARPSWMH